MISGQQPSHSRFDLAPSPSAVRWGRKHAAEILATWGIARPVADDALVIVSELLSNAVQHASQPFEPAYDRPDTATCSLLLWLTGMGLTVSVYDGDRRPPVMMEARSDAERGRGLRLVEALSEVWGYTYPQATTGKIVWARLPLPEHLTGESREGLQSAAQSAGPVASPVMSA